MAFGDYKDWEEKVSPEDRLSIRESIIRDLHGMADEREKSLLSWLFATNAQAATFQEVEQSKLEKNPKWSFEEHLEDTRNSQIGTNSYLAREEIELLPLYVKV